MLFLKTDFVNLNESITIIHNCTAIRGGVMTALNAGVSLGTGAIIINTEQFKRGDEQLRLFSERSIDIENTRTRVLQERERDYHILEATCAKVVSAADRFASDGAANIRNASLAMGKAISSFFDGRTSEALEHADRALQYVERGKTPAMCKSALYPNGHNSKKVVILPILQTIESAVKHLKTTPGEGFLEAAQIISPCISSLEGRKR